MQLFSINIIQQAKVNFHGFFFAFFSFNLWYSARIVNDAKRIEKEEKNKFEIEFRQRFPYPEEIKNHIPSKLVLDLSFNSKN